MTIITSSGPSLELGRAGWQCQLKNAIRNPQDLSRALGIEVTDIETEFPLLVPLPYLQRMRLGDPKDPLLLQILPVAAELIDQKGFSRDPVAEQKNNSGPKGLIQKYRSRALIVATGTCAINCRYCFRRHFPYEAERLSREDWRALLEHIADDESIHEIILSGGDPLILNDRTLHAFIQELNKISHVTTLRVHTRLPVVIPERICDDLLDWIKACDKQVVFVTHINHPNELDQSLTAALKNLSETCATVLNQSVLLQDVNDNAEALILLSRKLFTAGVMPYYLHLLDPVQGAGHFNVSEGRGRELIELMSGQLPGYLVPKLAREVPGAPAKQVLAG